MARRRKTQNNKTKLISTILAIIIMILASYNIGIDNIIGYFDSSNSPNLANGQTTIISLEDIPVYSGDPYCVINGNNPYFTDEEMTDVSFETYNELDYLGRCTSAIASVGMDLMPTEDRGSISSVYPTAWVQAEYDIISTKHLYNRCHLIGFQLTGENANERNLITGTRYLNVDGMLPFEDMIADYVKETKNHVLYRVTVVFDGDNLLADGVLLEAKSVEDNGEELCFNVFCYNVQPGVTIDYATGESYLTN